MKTQVGPCDSTAKEVSNEWSHLWIPTLHSYIRTSVQYNKLYQRRVLFSSVRTIGFYPQVFYPQKLEPPCTA